MSAERPTLKDVANRSGYGLRTVKKVMSGQPGVKEQTREWILRTAQELNYTRNRAASALARNRKIRIAVVYSIVIDNAYFPEVERGFLQAERELRDFGLELEFFTSTDHWAEHQPMVLRQLLTRQDIDGVILEPSSGTQMNDLIAQLEAAGKCVVTFGSDTTGSRRLFHVGSDGYRSGRIAAQILANYIGKQGKVYLFSGMSDHVQDKARRAGFQDRIREHYPNITVQTVDASEDYAELVRSVVESGDAAGLFCTDARTILAGKVLQELSRTDIPLVGFDLSEDGKELMRSGFIKVIIEQKPELFSYLAAKRLFVYLSEGKMPREVEQTPLYILTSECLDD